MLAERLQADDLQPRAIRVVEEVGTDVKVMMTPR
jgi:hypothetical protein